MFYIILGHFPVSDTIVPTYRGPVPVLHQMHSPGPFLPPLSAELPSRAPLPSAAQCDTPSRHVRRGVQSQAWGSVWAKGRFRSGC